MFFVQNFLLGKCLVVRKSKKWYNIITVEIQENSILRKVRIKWKKI